MVNATSVMLASINSLSSMMNANFTILETLMNAVELSNNLNLNTTNGIWAFLQLSNTKNGQVLMNITQAKQLWACTRNEGASCSGGTLIN